MNFVVQHFIFCLDVSYASHARPQRDSTLRGVDIEWRVPPGTTFPFAPAEFWLFARFRSRSARTGTTRHLFVQCFWLDAPGGAPVEAWPEIYDVGTLTFHHVGRVSDRGWVFRNTAIDQPYPFPGLGLYEFVLLYEQVNGLLRPLCSEYVRLV